MADLKKHQEKLEEVKNKIAALDLKIQKLQEKKADLQKKEKQLVNEGHMIAYAEIGKRFENHIGRTLTLDDLNNLSVDFENLINFASVPSQNQEANLTNRESDVNASES